MWQRLGLVGLMLALMAGCASTDGKQVVKDAAASPLKDLNVIKVDIPTVLRKAERGTFAEPTDTRCEAVQAEIAALDEVLGRNGDDEDEKDGDDEESNLLKRGHQEVEKAAVKAIQNGAEDVVPFRKWVRKLTGAERRSKKLAEAVAAGYARRSFLRGYASALHCAKPVSETAKTAEPAQTVEPAQAAQADAYSSASAITVVPVTASLDWLVGSWCLQNGERVIEETWLPKRGDVWFGISRTVNAEATKGFEFVRIAMHDGVLSYLAQPDGGPMTVFTRTGGGEKWIRFENPQHDFPTRIEYHRDGDNLTATIFGPDEQGSAQGKEKSIRYPYQRCAALMP